MQVSLFILISNDIDNSWWIILSSRFFISERLQVKLNYQWDFSFIGYTEAPSNGSYKYHFMLNSIKFNNLCIQVNEIPSRSTSVQNNTLPFKIHQCIQISNSQIKLCVRICIFLTICNLVCVEFKACLIKSALVIYNQGLGLQGGFFLRFLLKYS